MNVRATSLEPTVDDRRFFLLHGHFDEEELAWGFHGSGHLARLGETEGVAAMERVRANGHLTLHDHEENAVSSSVERVCKFFTGLEIPKTDIRLLVDVERCILGTLASFWKGRDEKLEFSFLPALVESRLVVARGQTICFRFDPYLEEDEWFGWTGVVFGMNNPSAGAHDLDFSGTDNARSTGAVAMGHRSGEGKGDDLHVGMGMLAKSGSGSDEVIVHDPQFAKTHERGMVEAGEAETVEGLEPPVVKMPSLSSREIPRGHRSILLEAVGGCKYRQKSAKLTQK